MSGIAGRERRGGRGFDGESFDERGRYDGQGGAAKDGGGYRQRFDAQYDRSLGSGEAKRCVAVPDQCGGRCRRWVKGFPAVAANQVAGESSAAAQIGEGRRRRGLGGKTDSARREGAAE